MKIKLIPIHLEEFTFSPNIFDANIAVIKYPRLVNGYIRLMSRRVIENSQRIELIAYKIKPRRTEGLENTFVALFIVFSMPIIFVLAIPFLK